MNVRLCPLSLPQLPESDGLALLCPALFAQSAITVEGDAAGYPSSDLLETRLFAWR